MIGISFHTLMWEATSCFYSQEDSGSLRFLGARVRNFTTPSTCLLIVNFEWCTRFCKKELASALIGSVLRRIGDLWNIAQDQCLGFHVH